MNYQERIIDQADELRQDWIKSGKDIDKFIYDIAVTLVGLKDNQEFLLSRRDVAERTLRDNDIPLPWR